MLAATALFASMLAALGTSARADDIAAPTAGPAAAAEKIVGPLREIGRVRARTPYCSALIRGGAAAAQSSVAYEIARVTAFADLHDALIANRVQRTHAVHELELDLARMVALAREGRTELHGLQALADTTDDEKATAVLGFRDALDGAKARQLAQIRDMAEVLGTLEEQAPRAPDEDEVTQPDDGAALIRLESAPVAQFLDPFGTAFAHARTVAAENKALLRAADGDAFITSDMVRAGENATRALALGNCATE
jgi:hypothetical protein